MRELISTSEKKAKAQAGNEWSNILPKILAREKKATSNNTRVPSDVASVSDPFQSKGQTMPSCINYNEAYQAYVWAMEGQRFQFCFLKTN